MGLATRVPASAREGAQDVLSDPFLAAEATRTPTRGCAVHPDGQRAPARFGVARDFSRVPVHASAGQVDPARPSQPSEQMFGVRAVLGRGAGRRLGAAVLADMESRFGESFGDVRLHVGEAASDSARAIGAAAYTVGHDIVFGGACDPTTTQRERGLLAHELAHVLQQRQTLPSSAALSLGADDSQAEHQARAMAGAALSGTSMRMTPRAVAAGTVQRAPDTRTDAEIDSELMRRTGKSVPDLILGLGRGPIAMKPRELEAELVRRGDLREIKEDHRPQVVMDEVIQPHPYNADRMITVARIGTEADIEQKKTAGQRAALDYIQGGLMAAGGARTGSASESLVSPRGGAAYGPARTYAATTGPDKPFPSGTSAGVPAIFPRAAPANDVTGLQAPPIRHAVGAENPSTVRSPTVASSNQPGPPGPTVAAAPRDGSGGGGGRGKVDRRPPPAGQLDEGEGLNPDRSVRRVGGKQGLSRGTDSLRDANAPIERVYRELNLSPDERQQLHKAVHLSNLDYKGILEEAFALWPNRRK